MKEATAYPKFRGVTPEVIRARRRSLTVRIHGSFSIAVSAPLKMPDKTITDFLEQKRCWIEKRLETAETAEAKFKPLVDGIAAPLNGSFSEIVYKTGKACIEDGIIFIPARLKHLQPDKKEAAFKRELIKAYKAAAENTLPDRAAALARNLSVFPSNVSICGGRSRWGTCRRDGLIKLNYRLLALPPELCDYVIFHELTHLKRLDHSRVFWAELEALCPNYKKLRKQLKEYAPLMDLL